MAMNAPFHHISDHATLTSQPRDPHSSPNRMRKIHMTSPPTPPTTIPTNTDNFTIEELSESDQLGDASDIEIIYPDELEEVESSTSDTDDHTHQETEEETDPQGSDTVTIAKQIRRLRCKQDKAAATPSSSSASSPTRRQHTPITTPARKRLHDETFPSLESEYAGSPSNTSDDQAISTSARKVRRLRAPLAAISSPPAAHSSASPATGLGDDSMDIDSYGTRPASPAA